MSSSKNLGCHENSIARSLIDDALSTIRSKSPRKKSPKRFQNPIA